MREQQITFMPWSYMWCVEGRIKTSNVCIKYMLKSNYSLHKSFQLWRFLWLECVKESSNFMVRKKLSGVKRLTWKDINNLNIFMSLLPSSVLRAARVCMLFCFFPKPWSGYQLLISWWHLLVMLKFLLP